MTLHHYAVTWPRDDEEARTLHEYRDLTRTVCGVSGEWCISPMTVRPTDRDCPTCFPET